MIFRRILSLGLIPLCFIWLCVIEKNCLPLILILHMAVHEGGHIVAALLCKTEPRSAEGKYLGFNITFPAEALSYKKELAILLSGSGANLLCLAVSFVMPTAFSEFYFLSGLVIALFNLFPLKICDGGKAIACLLLMFLPEDIAVISARTVHFISALLFFAFAVCAQFVYRANLSLLVISVYVVLEFVLSD